MSCFIIFFLFLILFYFFFIIYPKCTIINMEKKYNKNMIKDKKRKKIKKTKKGVEIE
ncbi:hypothetical protein M8044_000462 [Columbia Basin potato purple top phytoplasma]|uniref:Uncharacterized protein n=1 Tax=Columbia Basin potato purple top phytoplasma TaxID=307134 RepID=A0ABT5LAU4_9MOLU|nr:hypothetical protein [Columbia Basin potato purple top phytoplasma]